MREKEAAVLLESAIGSMAYGSPQQIDLADEDLRGRVLVVERLAALDLAGDVRGRETLRARLQEAVKARRARTPAPPVRRPWVLRRPVLATELAILLVVTWLAVAAPGALAALVAPLARIVERVYVGEHTQLLRAAPSSQVEVAASMEKYRAQLAKGEKWEQFTLYGMFGGGVPAGEPAAVRRVSHLGEVRVATKRLQVPTGVHRNEPVQFDHAFLAPGGIALIFFGSGANEVFLSAFPVGEGRAVGYVRSTSRRAANGRVVLESPILEAEEMSLGGITVVWDPGPTRPANSALRWEEDGVSYSLMGRGLTREEAVELMLSRRPIEDVK